MKKILHNQYFKLILFIILFAGCEKPKGDVYLRVINTIEFSQDVVVRDQVSTVPIDGKYHKVKRFSEATYVLPDVIKDSFPYNLPSPSWPREYRGDETINASFGDFEILENDSYYTLTLDYSLIIEGPDKYILGDDVYYMYYRYFDNSKIESSSVNDTLIVK